MPTQDLAIQDKHDPAGQWRCSFCGGTYNFLAMVEHIDQAHRESLIAWPVFYEVPIPDGPTA